MKYALAACLAVLLAWPASAQQVPQSSGEIQLSFAPLVKQTAPAVVNIYAKVIRPGRANPFSADPFFERFFGDSFRQRPRIQNSLGSGVILSPDGIVVSNYHVVGNATDIRVVLSDRREFSARVLLGDEESDLAILQIEGAGTLPFLPLRDAKNVEVGELVLAIGNPFGVGQTVSSGIVSGLARSGAANSGQGYLIQTDAPINPGNSGGALIDVRGQLIGVNTSLLTRSGGSNGIGFAIPADLVAAFVRQASAGHDRFERPWAGVTGQTVDADLAQAYGLAMPGGVIIAFVHPASPFADLDLTVGDVIVAVNGQPVNTLSELVYRMSVSGAGSLAEVERLRNEDKALLSVPLVPAPDTPDRETLRLTEREILEGTEVVRVNPAVIEEFNLPLDVSGVVITDPGPLGRRVGLRRSDTIVAVGRSAVTRPADLARHLAKQAKTYEFVVLRGARRISIRFRT